MPSTFTFRSVHSHNYVTRVNVARRGLVNSVPPSGLRPALPCPVRSSVRVGGFFLVFRLLLRIDRR